MQKSRNIEKRNELNNQKEENNTGECELPNLVQKISERFFEIYWVYLKIRNTLT